MKDNKLFELYIEHDCHATPNNPCDVCELFFGKVMDDAIISLVSKMMGEKQ